MTDKIDNGGPAFPLPHTPGLNAQGGMSLRDWFAGQALPCIHDRGGRYGPEGAAQVAEYAYAIADAMIAEKRRSEGK